MASTISLVSCNDVKVPDVIKGEDTLINDLSGNPDSHDAKEVIYAVLGKLNKTKTYERNATTITKAQKGVINYTQETTSKFVRNSDEYYAQSSSHSNFVNSEHEAMLKNNLVAYRQNGSEIKTAEANNYASVFGVLPTKLLSGQIFNQETIIYAKLVSNNDNTYTYNIILDKDLANAALVYQMKEFGGLSSYPTFTDNTEFILNIDNTYTPLSYSVTASYNVSVAVLGDLACKEETTATFSNFNQQVSVPNTVELNAALNSSPTEIVPTNQTNGDKNLEAIVSALLNSNIDRGISLTGTLKLNDYYLPLKLNARANINEILTFDNQKIKNAIDASLTIPTTFGNLKVIYHGYKIYVELFDKKIVFDLPSSETSLTPINSSSLLTDFISVTKDDTSEEKYQVLLNGDLKAKLTNLLTNLGLLNENSNFDLSFDVYLNSNKLSKVCVLLTLGEHNFDTDFVFGDELFELPDLTTFESQLKVKSNIDISFQKSIGQLIDGTINFKYNTTETNVLKAISLDAKLDYGNSFKTTLQSTLNSFKNIDIPADVGAFLSADYARIILDNGRLFVGAGVNNDNKVTYFKEINVGESTNSKFDFLSLFDFANFFTKLFDIKISNNTITISANDMVIDLINEFSNRLFESLVYSLGSMSANTLYSIFGLYRRISNIDLSFTKDSSNHYSISFNINACEMSLKHAYNEKIDYTVSSLFNITLSTLDYDDNYELDWDYINILDNVSKANVYVDKISSLNDNFSLTSEYLESLTNLTEEIDGLENSDVKNLIYNYSTLSSLKRTYDSQLNTIKTFINYYQANKAINQLNSLYNSFSDAQISYLSVNNSEILNGYLEKRLSSESTTISNIQNSINNITEKDVTTLSADELYTYLNNLVSIQRNINSCINESLDSIAEDIKKFDTILDETIKQYVIVYSKIIDEYTSQLMGYKYSCNLSVNEMNSLYSTLSNFYSSKCYAFTDAKSPIYSILMEKYPEFECKAYIFNYYLSFNGLGFNAGAVKVIEKEIEAILNEEYSLDELESRISALKTLINRCGKESVSNYSQIVPIIENLEAKKVKEKVIEYTKQINDLIDNNDEEEIANFFDDFFGDYNTIKSFYDNIPLSQQVLFPDEYKALGEALENVLEIKPDSDDDDWW